MNQRRSSIITWIVIAVLLIGGVLLSALWPQISAQLPAFQVGGLQIGGGQPVPPPASMTAPICFDFIPIARVEDVCLAPTLVFLAIGALVIGAVVVTGIVLTVLVRIISRLVRRNNGDERYLEAEQTLTARQKEELKGRNEAQPTHDIPDHQRPRWSAFSTAMVLLLLVLFLATAIVLSYFPPGQLPDSTLVNLIVGGLLVVTLLVLALVLRPAYFRQIDETDNKPIAWGYVWVIITGAIMMGLGGGLMILLTGA